jgi:hypothetical protein
VPRPVLGPAFARAVVGGLAAAAEVQGWVGAAGNEAAVGAAGGAGWVCGCGYVGDVVGHWWGPGPGSGGSLGLRWFVVLGCVDDTLGLLVCLKGVVRGFFGSCR